MRSLQAKFHIGQVIHLLTAFFTDHATGYRLRFRCN